MVIAEEEVRHPVVCRQVAQVLPRRACGELPREGLHLHGVDTRSIDIGYILRQREEMQRGGLGA